MLGVEAVIITKGPAIHLCLPTSRTVSGRVERCVKGMAKEEPDPVGVRDGNE